MASPKKLDHVLPEQSQHPTACFWCGEMTTDYKVISPFYKRTPKGWERVDMEICHICAEHPDFRRAVIAAHYSNMDKVHPYA